MFLVATMKTAVLLALAATCCSADNVSTRWNLPRLRKLGDCRRLAAGSTGGEHACPPTTAPASTTAPAPAPATSGTSGCFSATTTLFVRGKGLVAMKDAKVGDMVKTISEDTFEPLYAFGHNNKEQEGTFLKITTDINSLEVTEEHLVFIAGKARPVRADSIKVGDALQAANGSSAVVKEIGSVVKAGLYAPLVPSGQIWVDGVLASSYVALQDEDKEDFSTFNGLIKIPHDAIVHFYLAPFRVVCMGMTDKPCHVMDSNGISLYISLCMESLRIAHNSAYAYYAQPLLMVFTFLLAVGFAVIEGLFGARMGPLIVFSLAMAYSISRKFTVRSKKTVEN